MIFYAKAPLRISFSGGGTDVTPCPRLLGGAVLNTTINKYVYTGIVPRKDSLIQIYLKDLEKSIFRKISPEYAFGDKLNLIRNVLRKFTDKNGVDLILHSDVPSGSGLGSSSALVVAMLGSIIRWKKIQITKRQIAEKAISVERHELEIAGGKQDQYAAVYGGFNFMEFKNNRVKIIPLKIPRETINELEYNLLLCYVGHRRASESIIRDQVAGYRKPEIIKALKRMNEITYSMRDMLLKGKLKNFGRSLKAEWDTKKKLSNMISGSHIDKLCDIGFRAGALGAKLSGAGGGGYILFYCDSGKKFKVAEELTKAGGQIKDFAFSYEGLQTWVANE